MNIFKRIFAFVFCIGILCGCQNNNDCFVNENIPSEDKRLTVCTSHKEDVWEPIVREFEERYGIWVDVIEGGTSELLTKIKDGKIKADVMFGGGIESLEAFSDCFTPYEVKDSAVLKTVFKSENNIWTPFSSLPIVLAYNPKLVSFDELQSWEDLLDNNFKGKIAYADPEVSGSSYTALMTMLAASTRDEKETMRIFAENLDGKVLASSKEVLESIYSGENYVGITIEETAYRKIWEGKDLKIVYPSDGTSCVPDGTAIVKGALHEENAQLFLDFTVSKDVQRLLTDKFYRRTVRIDIPIKAPLPTLSKLNILEYDYSRAGTERDKTLALWSDFLGGN